MSHVGNVPKMGTLSIDRLPKVGEMAVFGKDMGTTTTAASAASAAAGGPYQEYRPETARVRVKYTVAFHKDSGAFGEVKLTFKDMVAGLRNADGSDKLGTSAPVKIESDDAATAGARFSSTHSLPISLRIVAARVTDSLGTDLTGRFAFKLKDNKGKCINSDFPYKDSAATAGAAAKKVGYPLYLAADPDTREALEAPRDLLDEHKDYWMVKMDHLKENVTQFTDPVSNSVMVLMDRNGRPALLSEHALSKRNSIVTPDLRQHPAYRFPANPNNVLQIPLNMYGEVVNAYRKKLEEVDSKSFDLTNVFALLEPLPVFINHANEQALDGLVTFELVMHMPLAESMTVPSHEGDTEDEEDGEEDGDAGF